MSAKNNRYFLNVLWLQKQLSLFQGEALLWGIAQGVIEPDEDSGGYAGSMLDYVGPSLIRDIEHTTEVLRFSKLYHDRQEPIHFSLRWIEENGWYQGTFEGEGVPPGIARCIVTPAPEAFFRIPSDTERES